jgi:hypothetical protein
LREKESLRIPFEAIRRDCIDLDGEVEEYKVIRVPFVALRRDCIAIDKDVSA